MGIVVKRVGPSRWWLFNVELFHEGRFRVGTPDELISTAEDVRTIAKNFNALSKGPRPLLEPPVGVGHDSAEGRANLRGLDINPSFGKVVAAYPVPKDTPDGSKTFLEGILEVNDEEVAKWVDNEKLTDISPEIIDNPPENCPGSGQTLYRVALLGYSPPALKLLRGLRKAPSAVHSFAGQPAPKGRRRFVFTDSRKARRFSNGAGIMSKEEALQILAAAGIDTAGMEGLSDEQLVSIATKLKAAATTDPNAAAAMANQVRQFADQHAKTVQTIQSLKAELDAVKSRQEASELNAKTAIQEQAIREAHTFCDQASKEGRVTPAEIGTEEAPGPLRKQALAAAQSPTVHTFGDKKQTSLDLLKESVRARPVMNFRDKIATGKAGNVAPDGTPTKDPLDEKAEKALASRYKTPATAAASN